MVQRGSDLLEIYNTKIINMFASFLKSYSKVDRI